MCQFKMFRANIFTLYIICIRFIIRCGMKRRFCTQCYHTSNTVGGASARCFFITRSARAAPRHTQQIGYVYFSGNEFN